MSAPDPDVLVGIIVIALIISLMGAVCFFFVAGGLYLLGVV